MGVLLLATALRLPNLDAYTMSLPEGIRLEQLMLLSAGYQACRDVFCNQGPMALQAMHPTFVLFGQTLAAARSSAVIASLAGIAATYWLARQLWGARLALLGTLLLAISPTYLKFSRLALPEMVALAPALLALGLAARYQQAAHRGWLLAASACYGLSLLIKPVAAPAIVPLALLAGSRRGWRRADLVLAAGAGLAVVTLGVVLVGFEGIWEQVVFRWQSRLVDGRGVDWNLWKITDELKNDQLGIFALALAGGFRLLRSDRRALAVLGGWTAANLLLLLFHTPLHDKHIVIMLPPLALLAAHALDLLLERLALGRRFWSSGRAAAPAVAALAALVYVVTLPSLLARDHVLVSASEMIEPDPNQFWHADAGAALRAVTPSGSFVVTDFPYLAFLANRLVPPELVESSLTRIRAGSLTDELAVTEAARFAPRAILLWWDRLARLPGFMRWVGANYQVVRVYAADSEALGTLYLPLGSDLEPYRAALTSSVPQEAQARFGDGLELRRWGLSSTRVAAGDQLSASALWTATQPVSRRLTAVLTLRTADQVVWTSQRLPLLGNGDGQKTWEAGRWVVWSGLVNVPRKLAPGAYLLSIRVAESDEGEYLAVHSRDAHTGGAARDPKGYELGVIEVTTPRSQLEPAQPSRVRDDDGI